MYVHIFKCSFCNFKYLGEYQNGGSSKKRQFSESVASKSQGADLNYEVYALDIKYK